MKFRLRIHLLLILWGTFFLVLFLPSAYYNRYLKEDFLHETETRVGRELSAVAALIGNDKSDFSSAKELNDLLCTLSEELGIRFTYVAEGGRVIADSDVPFEQIAQLENHAGRPEIAQAYIRGRGVSIRYSATLKTDLFYVAQKIGGHGAIPGGTLRAAAPMSGIFYRLGHLGLALYLVVLIGFVSFVALSSWLVTHISRSVLALSRAAESIGTGIVKIPHLFQPRHEFYPLALTLKKTAERVESYIQTITKQKVQLEGILGGIEEAILLLDSEGKITSANRAARKMFPLGNFLEGRRPLELIRNIELQTACNRIIANEIQSYHSEVSLGPSTYYHFSVVRIEHSLREYGAILVLHDISDLKNLEQVRRDFVANASHELRTPLTSIKGYLELLTGEDIDSETRRSFLQIALRNTDQIIDMVNDLLQLAKLEDDSKPPNTGPVDAGEVLLEAWSTCTPISAEKEVTLENDLPIPGPLVQADTGQLIQVFRNLLENAIRFSPPGMSIKVSSLDEKGMVRFAVSDSGPGVPKQDQDRIFERFFRVERSREKKGGGTGLGLAICRHIVRAHGGRIWVESPRKGKADGSTFFFTVRAAGTKNREQPTDSGEPF
jgi:two-component system phosphate regulon sensor histidine kinase PhoR